MDNDNVLNLAVVHFLTPSEELNDPYFTAMRIGIENRCHHFNISLRNFFTTNLSSNSHTLAQAQAIICVGHFSDSDIALIYSLNKNLIFIDSAPLDKNVMPCFLIGKRLHAKYYITLLRAALSAPHLSGTMRADCMYFKR
nr:hypothetical protein KXZ65_17010 [Pectobacterium sp. PL152]